MSDAVLGTFAKIIHYLEIFLDKHPGDTAVLFCLATLYAREDRLAQAQDLLRAVITLDPDKTEAINLLAEVEELLAENSSQGAA